MDDDDTRGNVKSLEKQEWCCSSRCCMLSTLRRLICGPEKYQTPNAHNAAHGNMGLICLVASVRENEPDASHSSSCLPATWSRAINITLQHNGMSILQGPMVRRKSLGTEADLQMIRLIFCVVASIRHGKIVAKGAET